MKKIIILLFIIISFLNVSFYTYAEVTAPQQTRSKNYKSNDNKYGTEQYPVVIKIQDTQEGKDSAKKSTDYQRMQAVSSERLVIITVILAIFAILQWGIIFWQTCLLKKSVKAAELAANAANKSADSITIMESARLFVDVVEDRARTTPAMLSDQTRVVNITVHNYGRTPGIIKEVHLWMDFSVTDIPKENKITAPNGEAIKIIQGIVMLNEKPITQQALVDIAAEDWSKIESGQTQWHCWGSIKYESIFKGVCEVGFDWRWHPLLKRFIRFNNENLNYHTYNNAE